MQKYILLSDVAITPQTNKEDSQEKRKFSGIANSGKPFNLYGTKTIIDLSDISFADKVPVLLEHNRNDRIGFGYLSVQNNQLRIDGEPLNNELAKSLAKDADDGFPWQMSVHVKADKTERLGEDEEATVNGQKLSGSLNILRKCQIAEVSFTPTGVDNLTEAALLSDDGNQPSDEQPNNQEEQMKLEEALQKIDELSQALEAKDKRLSELELSAKLSAKGFKQDENGKWQGLSEGTINLLLSADTAQMQALIEDLASVKQPNQKMADVLLAETFGNTQTPQPSENPLILRAIERSKGAK